MTTTTRRAPRAHKAEKPLYPELPNTDHPGFWLAAFFRDMAELDCLDKLHSSLYRRSNVDRVTCTAISGAIGHARQELATAAGYVKDEGLLPFAHQHTTYFAQQGGAA